MDLQALTVVTLTRYDKNEFDPATEDEYYAAASDPGWLVSDVVEIAFGLSRFIRTLRSLSLEKSKSTGRQRAVSWQ